MAGRHRESFLLPLRRGSPAIAGLPFMRPNGVEPSRPVRDTRPSTLRVYQFRHGREGGRF
jgi:hypothetical protein